LLFDATFIAFSVLRVLYLLRYVQDVSAVGGQLSPQGSRHSVRGISVEVVKRDPASGEQSLAASAVLPWVARLLACMAPLLCCPPHPRCLLWCSG
jgi:hypothetical protein